MAIYNCEMCKYGTDNKAHYAIHCNSKRHCQLVGTPYQVKAVTKKAFEDVTGDLTRYNEMKKVDMQINPGYGSATRVSHTNGGLE